MRKIVSSIVWISAALWIGGCGGPDKAGWYDDQKKDFLEILKEDCYVSVCGDDALVKKIEKSGDSHLMSRMLLRYVHHLANGCIDIERFKKLQESRQSDDFKSDYTFYEQKVDDRKILNALRAGADIDTILEPYVPPYREFERLGELYRRATRAAERGTPILSHEALHSVRLNIERVKLMKPVVGLRSYVLVNIPEFKVRVIEENKTVLSMPVIVGKRRLQTPIFGEFMQEIVVNPQWNVPDSIARKEVIPKLLKDPNYLKRSRLVIRKDYRLDSSEVSFDPVVAQTCLECNTTIPFKFIEPPSKRNCLGRVKFLFPNRFAVYMHDTQTKYLFKRKVRTFSHGCVRLSSPNKMLRYIVDRYTDTSWEALKPIYESLKTYEIPVTKPLLVHTAYLTAYVDDAGKLKRFKDIYGYDKIQRLNFKE